VMPGGFGTMLELLTALEFVHARDLTPRPLLVYEPFWRDLLEPMHNNRLFRTSYWQYIQMVDTPESIVEAFQSWEANER
jgi:predicted Rossmann-fold nucleotide-binding protein